MTPDADESLLGKAARELRAALALWRREAACHAVDVSPVGDLVYVSPQIRAQTQAMALDRFAQLRTGVVTTQALCPGVTRASLAGDRPAVIRGDRSCGLQALACAVTLFQEMRPNAWTVDFTPMARRATHAIPITPLRARARRFQWGAFDRPKTGLIRAIRFKTTQASRKIQPLKGKSRAFPASYLRMPLLKSPIPALRFLPAMKDRFRRALAEKAGTVPANVLLNVAYCGLNRLAFANVSADDRGMLRCEPRPEAVGLRRSMRDFGETCYLAVGQQVDTRTRISALVSAEDA